MRSRSVNRVNFNAEIAKKENASKLSNVDETYVEENYETGLTVRKDSSVINTEPMTEIRPDYHMGRYTTRRIGRHEMFVSYKKGKEKLAAVSVRENPAKIINIAPDNFAIGIGETQVISVKFNKPLLKDQTPPYIELSDNLTVISEFKLNSDRTGGTFTIKALVEGKSTIDVELAGEVTSSRADVKDEPVNKKNEIYKDTKNDINIKDIDVINDYIISNMISPITGDVFIINTVIDGKEISLSSYIYNNGNWDAITGNVDAANVILRKDIILAGDYTNVGNIKLDGNSKTYSAIGKSLQTLIDEIFTQRIQPTIIENPSVANFNIDINGIYEVGTHLSSINYGKSAVFKPGKYRFGLDTEVSLRNAEVRCVINGNSTVVGSSLSGTDDNSGKGYTLNDNSSIYYEATINHSRGSVALDNIGDPSSPEVYIKEGSFNIKSNVVKSARKMFFGGLDDPAIDSVTIRELNSDFIESNKTFEFEIKEGTKHVIIACESSKTGVTEIINKTALSADYTNVFEVQVIQVEGNNGYKPIDYNVWVYSPLKPFEFDTTFEVTMEI